MDPLSVTANIITVLQVTNTLISLCYEVRSALKQTPWTLTRIIDEIRDLRNILEKLDKVCAELESSTIRDTAKTRSLQLLCATETSPLNHCYKELKGLERRISTAASSKGKTKPFSKICAATQVLRWQLKEDEVKSFLQQIERCKSTILLALMADETALLLHIDKTTSIIKESTEMIDYNVSRLLVRVESSEMNERSRVLTQWLSPIDPWESHDIAASAHDPGTGEWFMKLEAFQAWTESQSSGLWLSGFPGSGKTVLFANVIGSLEKQSMSLAHQPLIAFFYCDFRRPETQDLLCILGTLLWQICSQLDFCPEDLEHAFNSSRKSNKKPTVMLLKQILCSLSVSRKIILLVDGVDECHDRKEFLETMTYFVGKNISVFLTSRQQLDIEDALTSFEHVRIESWTQEVDQDIRTYIEHRMQSDHRLLLLKDNIREEIKQCLQRRSCGMFRLVQCSLDAVSTLRTVRDIRKALQHLPYELGETYENILLRVSTADAPIVRKILLWLSFTVVPITLEELHSAIAIEQGVDTPDEDSFLSSAQEILAICGSLITVSKTVPSHVRLAHLTVKDYLLSEEIRQGPVSIFSLQQMMGKYELALDCFTYLSYRDFQSGPSPSEAHFTQRQATYPFLQHASTAWTYYLRASESAKEPSKQLDEKILGFFSPENHGAFMSWVQVLNAGSTSNNSNWATYPKHATPLYYAASFGLLQVVQNLIDRGVDIDAAVSRYGGTALHGAVCRNQVPIIRTLIEAGADVTKCDWDHVTPLHTAAAEGYVGCVRLLLQHGAHKDALDRGGEKPLDWAINAEQRECRELLEGDLKMTEEDAQKMPEIQLWTGWVGNYIPAWSH